jgi:cation transport regulator ChaB
MSSSCPSGVERDRMLENITKTSHRDLDEELKRKHVEIEDEFRIEQTRLQDEFKKQKSNNARDILYDQFNQAINRLKESIKKGDYEGEVAHRMTADWLNSELKKRGY